MKLSESKKSRLSRKSVLGHRAHGAQESIVAEASDQSVVDFAPVAGQWIEVRSFAEIVETLDQQGTLGGLPFMPEMISLCGKRLRVKRFANKTCVNGESNYIGRLDECVVLQTNQRCDGSSHAGCEMGCQFFWKTQWLRPDGAGPAAADSTLQSARQNDPQYESSVLWLAQKTLLRTKSNAYQPRQYRCQATELVQIAKPIGPFRLKQYVDDHRRDGVSVNAIGSFLFSLVAKKLLRKSDHLSGPNRKRTPTATIGLEIGQRVRVKTLADIRETLDVNGCNRGLWFDPQEMGQFCERELVVSRKVTKMIDEKTGRLRIIKQPTVVLSETQCSGVFRRFCSRGMLHFWREIWLERVE